eukprot:SAG11_NODE_162_length_13962_cov_19.035562_9_plen_105_part_00
MPCERRAHPRVHCDDAKFTARFIATDRAVGRAAAWGRRHDQHQGDGVPAAVRRGRGRLPAAAAAAAVACTEPRPRPEAEDVPPAVQRGSTGAHMAPAAHRLPVR